jgi:hypothetical protein
MIHSLRTIIILVFSGQEAGEELQRGMVIKERGKRYGTQGGL